MDQKFFKQLEKISDQISELEEVFHKIDEHTLSVYFEELVGEYSEADLLKGFEKFLKDAGPDALHFLIYLVEAAIRTDKLQLTMDIYKRVKGDLDPVDELVFQHMQSAEGTTEYHVKGPKWSKFPHILSLSIKESK